MDILSSVVIILLILIFILSLRHNSTKTEQNDDDFDNSRDDDNEVITATNLMMEYEQDYYFRIKKLLPDYILMHCQVSFSAFLTSKEVRTRNTFNRAHCDILLTTVDFQPLVIVEIDGSSHRSSRVKARDKKRDTITLSAGIPTIRINNDFTDRDIKRCIEKAVCQRFYTLKKSA